MSRISLASSHSAGKGGEGDIIFDVLRKAKEAIIRYGSGMVVDGRLELFMMMKEDLQRYHM